MKVASPPNYAVVAAIVMLLPACASQTGMVWQQAAKDRTVFERDKTPCIAEARRLSAPLESAGVAPGVWRDAYAAHFVDCMVGRGWDRVDDAAATYPRAGTASVTDIQRRLNALGYAAGPIDGIAGPRTRGAIRDFQARNGLTVDGVAGLNTQAVLLSDEAR